jgi:hypothetical protein
VNSILYQLGTISYGIAIGNSITQPSVQMNNIILGSSVEVLAQGSTSNQIIGNGIKINSTANTVAIGSGCKASGSWGVVIGENARIGAEETSNDDLFKASYGIAIGANATCNDNSDESIAIGHNNTIDGNNNVSIGAENTITKTTNSSNATNYNVAIGNNIKIPAGINHKIAIGRNITVDDTADIFLGAIKISYSVAPGTGTTKIKFMYNNKSFTMTLTEDG